VQPANPAAPAIAKRLRQSAANAFFTPISLAQTPARVLVSFPPHRIAEEPARVSALPIRTPADRLLLIVAAINAALEQRRALVRGPLRLLADLVSAWLQPVFRRVIALANEAAAGTLLAAPCPADASPPSPAAGRTRPERARKNPRLPGRVRWLAVLLGSDGAAIARQFRDFLADPATAAFLATAAPRLGTTLRPLCRALGVAPVRDIRLRRTRRARRPDAAPRPPRPTPEPLPVLPEPYKPPPIEPAFTFVPTDPAARQREDWIDRQQRERRWRLRFREI
jgi:hypothetical protein